MSDTKLTKIRPGVYAGVLTVTTPSGEEFFKCKDRMTVMKELAAKKEEKNKPRELLLGQYEHFRRSSTHQGHLENLGGMNSWDEKIREAGLVGVKFDVVLRERK